jgi:hypothetical protein
MTTCNFLFSISAPSSYASRNALIRDTLKDRKKERCTKQSLQGTQKCVLYDVRVMKNWPDNGPSFFSGSISPSIWFTATVIGPTCPSRLYYISVLIRTTRTDMTERIKMLKLLKLFHYTPWRSLGGEKYSSYSFSNSELEPAALYPRGKDPRYPLNRRLGGPQSRSRHRG